MPASVTTVTIVSSVVNVALASSQASCFDLRDWYSVNTGNKGAGHRALGKQFAQQAGDAEGDEERIGRGRGAEQPRQHHVADEAQNAAGKGGDPDDARRLHQRAIFVL